MIDFRKSMQERNPVVIGLVGTAVLVALILVAFNVRAIDLTGSRTNYGADFADASGLFAGDPVMIAGVTVGQVGSISIAGDHVHAEFDLGKAAVSRMGDATTAAIKVRTVLGQRYIELSPDGGGRLAAGSTIPLSRTSSGYDIARDLEEVTSKVTQTDKATLSATLDELSSVADGLSPTLRSTIDGVRRLSTSVGSRDTAVKQLLASSASVSGIVAERDRELAAMFGQGQTLFAELNRRSDNIHRVLVQTRDLAESLTGLSADVRAQLTPALTQLGRVIDLLNRNYDNINQSISGFKTFTYQLNDAVGSGPYFQVLLQNIIPADVRGQQPLSPAAPR